MGQVKPGEEDDLDIESRAALEFAIGAFNLSCSLIPPRLMKIIALLGFPSDRELALVKLKEAFRLGGVRSPISCLALLLHHVLLQSGYCHGELLYVDEADEILRSCRELFPDGAIFHMFEGRLARLRKNIEVALPHFYRAAEVQANWKPLQHLCWCKSA